MKGIDRAELNIATIETYALVMGLLERFSYRERAEIAKAALNNLPPAPDHHEDPAGLQCFEEARKRLEALLA